MKLSYPSLSEANQNDLALTLKIARHSCCTTCDSCPGLRPPAGVEVVLDDDAHQKSLLGDLTQYGSDEEDSTAYLETCICGHDVADHGGQVSSLGREEFSRRARLATHLDELFQEADRLLDFNYTDEDIDSLRQQMKMPVSMVSIASPSIRMSFILLPTTSQLFQNNLLHMIDHHPQLLLYSVMNLRLQSVGGCLPLHLAMKMMMTMMTKTNL
ncbi:uncharacterized protein EDB91DRAFT_1063347 [Suillus paluster]|uniref:uncharacterized protein n=1 Tax=Suillus paluster TaxID=48578 RepID=UPI001B87CFD3|nr:uncharacterized protein EDB91DRAFT_1063347 [Suillus paluster]KAG1723593.1 hypothetical protein EDB91DRAFT_1063347 [Suillus paluster]